MGVRQLQLLLLLLLLLLKSSQAAETSFSKTIMLVCDDEKRNPNRKEQQKPSSAPSPQPPPLSQHGLQTVGRASFGERRRKASLLCAGTQWASEEPQNPKGYQHPFVLLLNQRWADPPPCFLRVEPAKLSHQLPPTHWFLKKAPIRLPSVRLRFRFRILGL